MGRKKALILGWYNHHNIGDESYKITFSKFFNQKYDLYFNDNQDHYHDFLVIGGGDIFSGSFTEAIIQSPKPSLAISVTLPLEPNQTALNKLHKILVRDSISYNLIKDMNNSYFCPDLGFLLESNKYCGKQLIKKYFEFEKRDLYKNVITVITNSHLIAKPHDELPKDILFKNFSLKLAQICDTTNASFLFLPFSTQMPWDDRISNSIVANQCKFWKKNLVIYDRLSVQDTLDIIGASNAIISMRLHSSIFSCVSSVPFIDITHNHKNKRLLNDLDLLDLSIDYKNINSFYFSTKLTEFIREESDIKEKIISVNQKQKEKIQEFYDTVCCI